MRDNIEREIDLSRRDYGNLSETLVAGLNRHLPDFLQEYVSDCTEDQYFEYIGDRPVRVSESELNPYNWMGSKEVDTDSNLSWRPDLIAVAYWSLHRSDREWEVVKEKLNNPNTEDPPLVDKNRLKCRVHYPIEVKSGNKITLTEQQSMAIPKVVEESDYVHPLMAEVDISNLPDSYEIKIQTFSDSPFNGKRFKT